jgi:hypothetical protein
MNNIYLRDLDMETSTHTSERMPRVNIIAIRDMLVKASDMKQEAAEAIAKAIDMGAQEQDTAGFATKNDLNKIVDRLEAKIDLINHRFDSLIDKIVIRVFLAMGTVVGVYKAIEYLFNRI